MHTHQPDSIFTGVIKYLGWESYFNTEISGMMPFFYVFDIPECTVSELGEELKEKIGMNGVRIVGNPEDKMKRVAIVAHLYPNRPFWHSMRILLLLSFREKLLNGQFFHISGMLLIWENTKHVSISGILTWKN